MKKDLQKYSIPATSLMNEILNEDSYETGYIKKKLYEN